MKKFIKKFVGIVLAALMLLSVLFISGCSDSTVTVEKDTYFVYVGSSGYYDFVYDKFTKIMYVQYSDTFHSEKAMSVLYNEEGKPMTYSEWSKLGDDIK